MITDQVMDFEENIIALDIGNENDTANGSHIDLQQFNATLKNLEDKITILDHEVNQYKNEIQSLRRDKDLLKKDYINLKVDNEKHKAKIRELENFFPLVKSDIRGLSDHVNGLAVTYDQHNVKSTNDLKALTIAFKEFKAEMEEKNKIKLETIKPELSAKQAIENSAPKNKTLVSTNINSLNKSNLDEKSSEQKTNTDKLNAVSESIDQKSFISETVDKITSISANCDKISSIAENCDKLSSLSVNVDKIFNMVDGIQKTLDLMDTKMNKNSITPPINEKRERLPFKPALFKPARPESAYGVDKQTSTYSNRFQRFEPLPDTEVNEKKKDFFHSNISLSKSDEIDINAKIKDGPIPKKFKRIRSKNPPMIKPVKPKKMRWNNVE